MLELLRENFVTLIEVVCNLFQQLFFILFVLSLHSLVAGQRCLLVCNDLAPCGILLAYHAQRVLHGKHISLGAEQRVGTYQLPRTDEIGKLPIEFAHAVEVHLGIAFGHVADKFLFVGLGIGQLLAKPLRLFPAYLVSRLQLFDFRLPLTVIGHQHLTGTHLLVQAVFVYLIRCSHQNILGSG